MFTITRSALYSTAVLAMMVAAPGIPYAANQASPAAKAWNVFSASHPGWHATWASALDQVSSLRGLSAVSSADPSAIAMAFMSADATLLDVAGGVGGLKLLARVNDGTDNHLSYQQTIDGLPVFNGLVDVHMNGQGQIYLVNNNAISTNGAKALKRAPLLSPAAAADLAKATPRTFHDKAGRAVTRSFAPIGQPVLGVLNRKGGAKLAYRVEFGPYASIVDADTGAVLDTVEYMQSVNGTGTIFDPNPVNTLDNTGLKDQANADYAALRGAYYTDKVLRGITKTGTGAATRYNLAGPYAKALDLKASSVGSCMTGETEVRLPPQASLNGKFAFHRNQSNFEHVMAYYHIDRSQRYIQSLGLSNWNKQIRVDAHAFPEDNSFYCGSPSGGGYLAFGDGGVDDAEEADVVLHEYGHALQDNASSGKYLGGGQAGAMGEGFGDYWAFQSKAAGKWGNCFAEWDGQGTCLRHVNTSKKFPRDYVNEVHADGEIWSRGLHDVFVKLGKDKANKIILKSHFLIAASPNFSKGLTALLDADHALYADADKNDICSAFVERGISAPGCGYWIHITWPKLGADVDLHGTPPAPLPEVYYGNRAPNWGDQTTADDDPLLYQDCITSCASEEITVASLPTPGTYLWHAYYYWDHDLGATSVSMEVFRGSKKLFSGSSTLADTGDDWDAFSIVVPPATANGTAEAQIVPVNTHRTLPRGPAKE